MNFREVTFLTRRFATPYPGGATIYLAHQTLGILKLDESCISNPKARKFKLDCRLFRLAPPI